MNEQWIVRIEARRAADLARLRRLPGLHVAEGGDNFWLRLPAGGEATERLLRTLAGTRFRLIEGGRLVPWGNHVPTERLPNLDWRPVDEWAVVTLPVAALSGVATHRVKLGLVRCRAERPATALLTETDCWFSYATEAPEVRLRPLAFAISAHEVAPFPHPEQADLEGRHRERTDAEPTGRFSRSVFVLGTPLPAMLGRPYAVDDGIAVACGWSISPAVGSAVIRQMLSLERGDVALFHLDGSFERIAAQAFVKASRSAVRASVAGGGNV